MSKNFRVAGLSTRKSKGSNSRNKSNELRNFAYNMGRVQQGLSKDTQVKDSYNSGLKNSSNKTKKPLY